MTGGLLELGEILLATSQRRLDVVSRNVANASTPGFKSGVMFESAIQASSDPSARDRLSLSTDFSQGAMRGTGRALDVAISGQGFFQLRDGEHVYYTRAGAFDRDDAGRLVDAQGFALQSSDGSDIFLTSGQIEILADGVVLESGAPIARIGVFEESEPNTLTRSSGNHFTAHDAMTPAAAVDLHQGMLEAANVDMAAQMLEMMTALRSAEVGARVVQAYDTLMGQTISTFGGQ